MFKSISIFRTFCLSALILSGPALFAQVQRGKVTLGGGFRIGTDKVSNAGSTGSKTNTYSVEPRAGYFVSDRFLIGAGFSVTLKDLDVNGQTQNETQFAIGPFGRYYVPLAKSFFFFGEAGLNYSTQKSTIKIPALSDTEWTVNGFAAHISPGFAFFPARNIGIEFKIDAFEYRRMKQKSNGAEQGKTSAFSVGTDLFTPMIGLQFYF